MHFLGENFAISTQQSTERKKTITIRNTYIYSSINEVIKMEAKYYYNLYRVILGYKL